MEAMLEESLLKWAAAHPPAADMKEAGEFVTNQEILDMLVDHVGDAPMLKELNAFMKEKGYEFELVPGTMQMGWMVKN